MGLVLDEMNDVAKATFVDVFAGCGGLSLGLMQAGWKGLFAIERDSNAFETLRTNLLEAGNDHKFSWPTDLPVKALSIDNVLRRYRNVVTSLAGQVDMLVGGPPCQGFSTAGRRDPSDPRNSLVKSYLRLVRLLQPKIVLIENVRGMTLDFDVKGNGKSILNYAGWLQRELAKGYKVSSRMIDTSTFGVPQKRHRFFIVALRKDVAAIRASCPFDEVEGNRAAFLRTKGLHSLPVSVKSAISDLEVNRNGTSTYEPEPRFQATKYLRPLTSYQKLMHLGASDQVSDTRLARHAPHIVARFKKIIQDCKSTGRLNVSLSKEKRESLGLKKCAIRVLDPDRSSPTITSMPDDLIHYEEPRCLTVRENARIQSFPDWFEFRGKYTTGGHRRRKEVPRFTQVANAVPPLVAEAFGCALRCYVSVDVSELDASILDNRFSKAS